MEHKRASQNGDLKLKKKYIYIHQDHRKGGILHHNQKETFYLAAICLSAQN